MVSCITPSLSYRLNQMREDKRIEDCHSLYAINKKLGPDNPYNREFKAFQLRVKQAERIKRQNRLEALLELVDGMDFQYAIDKAGFLYMHGATTEEASYLTGVRQHNLTNYLHRNGMRKNE